MTSANDENFARFELSDAQRADHHARREAILVRREEVRSGPGRPGNGDKLSSYSEQAAKSLGVDKRTVQRDLARGQGREWRMNIHTQEHRS